MKADNLKSFEDKDNFIYNHGQIRYLTDKVFFYNLLER